ncbi:MAG: electron transfer flavoprotein subunit beta/FixA family protein [Pseudomonadales bacterium]|nr:electron transfer flavoprotein subunit beta/FixA family protein [Pseudomonadales bacterium]
MKILVAVKRVLDANLKVRVKADKSGVDLSNAKMAMNPFCEIAVEEAIRLKEKGVADEVVAVSVGDDKSQEQLRTAMALGADRSILLRCETELEPLALAKLLKTVVDREKPDLVLLGKQSIDGDNNQVGQMLAALCGLSQGTFASSVDISGGKVRVCREIDGGEQSLELVLPALITTDLRLNEPRYATLPNIMKARKKNIEIMAATELAVDLSPRLQTLSVEEPPARTAGIIVGNVAELVEKLRNEAKVL